jgi:hypothetical protein
MEQRVIGSRDGPSNTGVLGSVWILVRQSKAHANQTDHVVHPNPSVLGKDGVGDFNVQTPLTLPARFDRQ